MTMKQATGIILDAAAVLRARKHLIKKLPKRYRTNLFIGSLYNESNNNDVQLGIVQIITSSQTDDNSTWWNFFWHLIQIHDRIDHKKLRKRLQHRYHTSTSSNLSNYQNMFCISTARKTYLSNCHMIISMQKYTGFSKAILTDLQDGLKDVYCSNVITRDDFVKVVMSSSLIAQLVKIITSRSVIGCIRLRSRKVNVQCKGRIQMSANAEIQKKNLTTSFKHLKKFNPIVFKRLSSNVLIDHLIKGNAGAIMLGLRILTQAIVEKNCMSTISNIKKSINSPKTSQASPFFQRKKQSASNKLNADTGGSVKFSQTNNNRGQVLYQSNQKHNNSGQIYFTPTSNKNDTTITHLSAIMQEMEDSANMTIYDGVSFRSPTASNVPSTIHMNDQLQNGRLDNTIGNYTSSEAMNIDKSEKLLPSDTNKNNGMPLKSINDAMLNKGASANKESRFDFTSMRNAKPYDGSNQENENRSLQARHFTNKRPGYTKIAGTNGARNVIKNECTLSKINSGTLFSIQAPIVSQDHFSSNYSQLIHTDDCSRDHQEKYQSQESNVIKHKCTKGNSEIETQEKNPTTFTSTNNSKLAKWLQKLGLPLGPVVRGKYIDWQDGVNLCMLVEKLDVRVNRGIKGLQRNPRGPAVRVQYKTLYFK